MPKDPAILRDSTNPRELVDTARLFAVSPDPADQQVLAQYLGSKDFLGRVDTPAAFEVYQPHQLRIAGVIRTLMEQTTPAPRATLVDLTTSAGFLSYDPLIQLLIRAIAVDRPASPKTIAYWEKYIHPDSVYSDYVVQAIFANRSRPALDLFERAMNDPGHEDGYKYVWLRDPMLQKRNELEVLECCERMVIGGTVDSGWHEPIIEAIFDFDPAWYLQCRKPRPPLRILTAAPARDSLERLGRHAIHKMELVIPTLGPKIRLALREVGRKADEDEKPDATA